MSSAPAPTHICLVCFRGTDHVNPMVALGTALQQKGHTVSFIGMLDYEQNIKAAGLAFIAIGTSLQPLGTLRRPDSQAADKSGQEALTLAISRRQTASRIELQQLPDILRSHHIATCCWSTRSTGRPWPQPSTSASRP